MPIKKEQLFFEMKEEDVVVLNVLLERDYQKLRIQGSFNAPLGDDHQAFVRRVEDHYGKDKFFITYSDSHHPSKAPEAAKLLRQNGFKAEEYIEGLQEWMESGYPVEGTLAAEMVVLD